MKYTKDNILNLRFRRGGETEYAIKDVYGPIGNEAVIIKNKGWENQISLRRALQYFNSGKWTVIDQNVQQLDTYQIY
jgi:hypothetical protein